MRSLSKPFYKSKEWQDCRASYIQEHPLCEICLEKGIINPAVIVHHKIHLNEDNYQDTTISLNHDNLQSVCQACHNEIHFKKTRTSRWSFDENNELQIDRQAPY